MNEVWRDIEGYDGLYQVSNLGNIKTMSRETMQYVKKYGKYRKYCKRERFLTPQKLNNNYLFIRLSKDGTSAGHLIHRLVAQAFIPNPNNLPYINHKDENKFNNCVDNLEWCTHKYNCNYGTRNERMCANRVLINNPKLSKPVIQLDVMGNVVNTYASLADAQRNGFSSGAICRVCKGKYNFHKGYRWKYATANEVNNK